MIDFIHILILLSPEGNMLYIDHYINAINCGYDIPLYEHYNKTVSVDNGWSVHCVNTGVAHSVVPVARPDQ